MKMDSKRALIGILQTQPNLLLAEMAGNCGYDFLIMDIEHGLFSDLDCQNTLQVLAATKVRAFVRLRDHNSQSVGRYMDMGVGAIMAPNVSTPEQAEALVRAMEYPPLGTRGFAASLHRATRFGENALEHLKAPRAGTSLFVMIESALGVKNVNEILTIQGVDGVFIGPLDLSAELGAIGDFSQPAYATAVQRIEQAAISNGKMLGAPPHPEHPVETLLQRGHTLLITTSDVAIMHEAMAADLRKVHSIVAAHKETPRE